MSVAIRMIDAAQAQARLRELAAILVDAVEHGSSVNFLAGFTLAQAETFWHRQLAGLRDGGRLLLIAEDGRRLVGTAVLTFAPQPNAPHRAELGKMLVHSAMRRRGIGARLLAAAEQAAQANGRTLLLLDTQTGSAGDNLYRAHGWTPFGIVPGHALTPQGVPAPTTFFYKQL